MWIYFSIFVCVLLWDIYFLNQCNEYAHVCGCVCVCVYLCLCVHTHVVCASLCALLCLRCVPVCGFPWLCVGVRAVPPVMWLRSSALPEPVGLLQGAEQTPGTDNPIHQREEGSSLK